MPAPQLVTSAPEFSMGTPEFNPNASVISAPSKPMSATVPSFQPNASSVAFTPSPAPTQLKLNSEEFIFKAPTASAAFVPTPAPVAVPEQQPKVEEKPRPAPVVAVKVEVPKKSELEIKVEKRLGQLSDKPELLLPVYTKIKSEKINEALLREFLSHMRKTEDLTQVMSVNLKIAQREAGTAKTL